MKTQVVLQQVSQEDALAEISKQFSSAAPDSAEHCRFAISVATVYAALTRPVCHKSVPYDGTVVPVLRRKVELERAFANPSIRNKFPEMHSRQSAAKQVQLYVAAARTALGPIIVEVTRLTAYADGHVRRSPQLVCDYIAHRKCADHLQGSLSGRQHGGYFDAENRLNPTAFIRRAVRVKLQAACSYERCSQHLYLSRKGRQTPASYTKQLPW